MISCSSSLRTSTICPRTGRVSCPLRIDMLRFVTTRPELIQVLLRYGLITYSLLLAEECYLLFHQLHGHFCVSFI